MDLCQAVAELELGQGDNLGGNVWKKRLRNNLSRSIVLTEPTTFWVFVHIFEKQDKANIAVDELSAFKKLAKDFGRGGLGGIEVGLKSETLKEICHDQKI
ncbi:type II toxin-antitoxin system RelE/ParE family toxin [Rhodoferax sp.]|uniref:type II toxin-antitoxin system RelE/ParE family toxin n=1 Tax=Rhodoferax sp. TaxID=50421 RepID=UPI0025F48BBE|nr:type II toxin-antitoxin system RelE/ParE family toxin [Rhodoferax sp.]